MKLRFSSLDDLRDYIQLIKPQNHSTTKNWTAAQNFFHLASAFEGSMDPLPKGYPFVVRVLIRPFRWIVTGKNDCYTQLKCLNNSPMNTRHIQC